MRETRHLDVTDILVFIFLFLSVFDQAREGLLLDGKIMNAWALSRDGLILYLFIVEIVRKRFKFNGVLIGLSCIFLLALNCLIGINNTLHIWSVLKATWLHAKWIFIYFIFYNYFQEKNYYRVIKYLINLGMALFLFNLIFSIWGNDFLTRLYSGGLRLTVGNSSIISYWYCTLIVICEYADIFPNKIVKVICLLIFYIAVITTVTTTAFIALICIIVIDLLVNKKVKIKKVGVIIGIIGILYFGIYSSQLFENSEFGIYVYSKLEQVIALFKNRDSVYSVGTLSIRKLQIEAVKKNMNLLNYLVGLGPSGYKLYTKYLENFYYVLLFDKGIFFFSFFCILITGIFAKGILLDDDFLLKIFAIFACYCFTLDFFLPYMTGFSFALVLAIYRREKWEGQGRNEMMLAIEKFYNNKK